MPDATSLRSDAARSWARELVSIAMPVRNAMPYLPAALQSLLDQTHDHLEILAVDDGSTDGSGEYLRAVDDARIRVLDSGGDGLVAALNLALAEARGSWFARQDADDLSDRFRIARQLEFLAHNQGVDLVATGAHFIDEESLPVSTDQTREAQRLQREAVAPGRLHDLLPLTCCIVHGSVMACPIALRSVGGYRHSHEAAEDYDLWLRMLEGHRLAMLPDVLYLHRLHGAQLSERCRTDRLRGTLSAKLDHLRTVATRLPYRANTVVTGHGTGATLYRELCARYELAADEAPALDGVIIGYAGAHEVRLPKRGGDDVDIAIVADFVDARRRVTEIEAQPGWHAHGNFLVRAHLW